jgi:hypothetical protein
MTDLAEPEVRLDEDHVVPNGELADGMDVVLDFAIDRLVARRTSLPVLRRGDLRTLVRRYRIFPGFGASFVEVAPENLFRQGVRQLAAMRAVGVDAITYVAAFTFPEILTSVIDHIDAQPPSPEDEEADESWEESTDVPMVELTPDTLPAYLCASVAARLGTAHVRKELEAIRRAPPRPPARRRPPVTRPKASKSRVGASPSTASHADGDSAEAQTVNPEPGIPPIVEPESAAPAIVEPGIPPIVAPESAPPVLVEPGIPPVVEPESAPPTVVEPEPESHDPASALPAPSIPHPIASHEIEAVVAEPVSSAVVDASAISPSLVDTGGTTTDAVEEALTVNGKDAPPLDDLSAIVTSLQALPVDGCDWETVGTLANTLHALHLARLDEQRRRDMHCLGARLRDVVDQFKGIFDAWGLTAIGDATSWSIDGVRPANATLVSGKLTTLTDAFAQWQATHDEGEPSVLARREMYRSNLRDAEQRISATYADVNEILTPAYDVIPPRVERSATPTARSVIGQLLRDGQFGTASRLLRGAGTAMVDAADLAEIMQRRMEFEFTRPLSKARAIACRVSATLATRDLAKQLEQDLSALVLQPPSQSVTHRQLADIFWNANVRLRQGHLSDFLGRMWNGIELALRLRLELVAGRRLDEAPSALAWWNNLDPESPLRRAATTSRQFTNFEKDGLLSMRVCLAFLRGLEEDAHERGDWDENERLHDARIAICALEPMKQLRNDSVVAHGTVAVSDEVFTVLLAKMPARRQELRLPPTLTGAAEVAWIYRDVMQNLGVTLEACNPLLAWGETLAGVIEES